MDLQEFHEHVERFRLEAVERLVKKYRTISPLLGKIEEVSRKLHKTRFCRACLLTVACKRL